MSARSKKLVSVGPGISAVIVTPVSLSSLRTASANDWTNAFEALYTAWNEPGIVEAIEEVNRTRPAPRSTISGSTRLARCTVELTLRSMMFEFVAQVGVPGEVAAAPRPALRAIASTGRPVARIAGVELLDAVEGREVHLDGLDLGSPSRRRLGRGLLDAGVLGGDQQVEAVRGELPGQLEPMPLDAPVTTAKFGSVRSWWSLPSSSAPGAASAAASGCLMCGTRVSAASAGR